MFIGDCLLMRLANPYDCLKGLVNLMTINMAYDHSLSEFKWDY